MRLFTLNGLTQEEDETPNKSQQWRDSCAETLMTTVSNNKDKYKMLITTYCKESVMYIVHGCIQNVAISKPEYIRKPLSLSVFTVRP